MIDENVEVKLSISSDKKKKKKKYFMPQLLFYNFVV